MKYFQNIYPHGGGCCGITHIFGLNNIREATAEMVSRDLNRTMTCCQEEMIEEDENFDVIHTHLYEIVLTTYQLTEVVKNALDLSGFVEVNRFVNSNSGNTCVVFHCLSEEYMEDPYDD